MGCEADVGMEVAEFEDADLEGGGEEVDFLVRYELAFGFKHLAIQREKHSNSVDSGTFYRRKRSRWEVLLKCSLFVMNISILAFPTYLAIKLHREHLILSKQ